MINEKKFRYYKIHESRAGQKFEIGDEYGILKVYEDAIQEKIEMTGYYYIDSHGEKVTTDEDWWSMDDIKKKKFYSQDNNEEIILDNAFVDLIYEYWDGHNWIKIWLDSAEFSSMDVEDVTKEVGKLKLIAKNEESTCNEYAYISDKGIYYYKFSSFYVGMLDFLEETDKETLKGIFEDLE